MRTQRFKWGCRRWEFYKPKRNKIKLSLLLAVAVFLIITPFTNWLFIPIGKLLNKYPLWVFK